MLRCAISKYILLSSKLLLVLTMVMFGANDDGVLMDDNDDYEVAYGKRFNDEITQSLVSRMHIIFKHHYNLTPSVIMMLAAIVKFNVDIPIVDNFKNSTHSELVYNDYHRSIFEAVQMMHGSVLILDIHSTSLPNDDDITVIYGGKSDATFSSCGMDSPFKRQNMSMVKAICGNYSSWGFLRRERLKVSPGYETCLKLELVDNGKGVTVNEHCVFSNCSNCVDVVKVQFSNKFNSNQTKSLIEALMKFITYHNYTKDILCKSFGTIQSTTVKYHHVSSLKSRNELCSKYQIRTTEIAINVYISEIFVFRATSGHLELRPKMVLEAKDFRLNEHFSPKLAPNDLMLLWSHNLIVVLFYDHKTIDVLSDWHLIANDAVSLDQSRIREVENPHHLDRNGNRLYTVRSNVSLVDRTLRNETEEQKEKKQKRTEGKQYFYSKVSDVVPSKVNGVFFMSIQVAGKPPKTQEVAGKPSKTSRFFHIMVTGDPSETPSLFRILPEVAGQPSKTQEVPGQPIKTQEVPGQPIKTQEVPGQPTKTQEVPGQPIKTQEVAGKPNKTQEVAGKPNKPPMFFLVVGQHKTLRRTPIMVGGQPKPSNVQYHVPVGRRIAAQKFAAISGFFNSSLTRVLGHPKNPAIPTRTTKSTRCLDQEVDVSEHSYTGELYRVFVVALCPPLGSRSVVVRQMGPNLFFMLEASVFDKLFFIIFIFLLFYCYKQYSVCDCRPVRVEGVVSGAALSVTVVNKSLTGTYGILLFTYVWSAIQIKALKIALSNKTIVSHRKIIVISLRQNASVYRAGEAPALNVVGSQGVARAQGPILINNIHRLVYGERVFFLPRFFVRLIHLPVLRSISNVQPTRLVSSDIPLFSTYNFHSVSTTYFQIFVKFSTETLPVSVHPSNTISVIRRALQSQLQSRFVSSNTFSEIRLTFQNILLLDTLSISHYSILPGSTIRSSYQLLGGSDSGSEEVEDLKKTADEQTEINTKLKPSTSDTNNSLNRPNAMFSAKPTKFFLDDMQSPETWLLTLETTYGDRGLVTSRDRFNFLLPLVPVNYVAKLSSTVKLTTVVSYKKPYEKFREAFEQLLQPSKSDLFSKYFRDQTLGDLLPSKFLSKCTSDLDKIQKGASGDEAMLRRFFLSALPIQHQQILSVLGTASLKDIALSADRLAEVVQPHLSASVEVLPSQTQGASASNFDTAGLIAALTTLTKQNADLSQRISGLEAGLGRRYNNDRPAWYSNRGQSPSRGNSFSRDRSPSPSSERQPLLCKYHFRFGDKAQYCHLGCQYPNIASTCKRHDVCVYHARFRQNARNCVNGCMFGTKPDTTASSSPEPKNT